MLWEEGVLLKRKDTFVEVVIKHLDMTELEKKKWRERVKDIQESSKKEFTEEKFRNILEELYNNRNNDKDSRHPIMMSREQYEYVQKVFKNHLKEINGTDKN